jgi:hypothetical protein
MSRPHLSLLNYDDSANDLPAVSAGVPMPRARGGRKFPFDRMAVGDSFETRDDHVRNAAYMHGVRNGQKFAARKANGVLRCWRVA